MKKNKNIDTKKKPASSSKKWIWAGVGIATVSLLSYFGIRYWSRNKSKATPDVDDAPDFQTPTTHASFNPKPKPVANDKFPLAKGSKGANVKALQEVLISKYGTTILPKYGADGDFGSEMSAALKKAGLPEIIDETTFNVLVKGSSPEPKEVAKQLYDYAIKKDLNKVLEVLKTLRNTEDYKKVSDEFVNYRINGVRQTLVNGLLNSFQNDTQKQLIRLAFSKMGLKYDGNKWSLAGIDNIRLLITNQPSKVWKSPKAYVNVPANMVLGIEIAKRGEYSLFENEQQYYVVFSKHVNSYQPK